MMDKKALTAACYSALTAFLDNLPKGGAAGSNSRYQRVLQQYQVTGQTEAAQQRAAIRAAFISMPADTCEALPSDLLASVDALLAAELATATTVRAADLPRVNGAPNIAVWQGDMSLLQCDAVVNPGNSALLGCFLPPHKCLDNILHAQAGPRLRIACSQMLRNLGIQHDVNGQCRPTLAFSLPSSHVFHTVGPCLVEGRTTRRPTDTDRVELRSCYTTCLDTAKAMGLSSIAFCCISTGIFGYPGEEAAGIALATTREWQQQQQQAAADNPIPLVVFNVFKDEDLAIYLHLAPKIFCQGVENERKEGSKAS
jgi:O-acetyl-ADP-ribose deacetylase (regulator of RNase III)